MGDVRSPRGASSSRILKPPRPRTSSCSSPSPSPSTREISFFVCNDSDLSVEGKQKIHLKPTSTTSSKQHFFTTTTAWPSLSLSLSLSLSHSLSLSFSFEVPCRESNRRKKRDVIVHSICYLFCVSYISSPKSHFPSRLPRVFAQCLSKSCLKCYLYQISFLSLSLLPFSFSLSMGSTFFFVFTNERDSLKNMSHKKFECHFFPDYPKYVGLR